MSKSAIRKILNEYLPLELERSTYQEKLARYQRFVNGDKQRNIPHEAIELEDIICRRYMRLIQQQTDKLITILDMIDSLTDSRQRTIIHMKYVEGVPFAEIENRLNISESTRKRELNLAIEELERKK